MTKYPSISAIFPSGSGVSVVHGVLERRLRNYHCRTYNPLLEYLPPVLMHLRQHAGTIMHAPPDHAVLVTPRESQLVVTFHNYYLDRPFARSSSAKQNLHYRTDLRWLTRKAMERAARITAVSRFIAEVAREDLGFPGEIRIIPNGINVARFSVQPQAHPGIRVLYSGNLSKRKGAHLLMPMAKSLGKDIDLWIASGLRTKGYTGGMAANMKVLGSISFDKMPDLYNQVDILVLPSLREGFGLVVAEAMACGLPVVASKCSAIPELIVEGQGGFLVEPGNVSGFAERLNYLAGDSSLRQRMGAFNRQRVVEQFNEDQMIGSYATLFAELA